MNFDRIKYYFDAGLWNAQMVKNAVRKGVITEEQYQQIIGGASTETTGETVTYDELVDVYQEGVNSVDE